MCVVWTLCSVGIWLSFVEVAIPYIAFANCMHMLMISVHCSPYCLVLATALQFKAVYTSV